MKVLKLNEKTLEWMGIRLHSAKGHSNDLWKSVNTYFVLLNIIMVIGTSATYMYKNHSSVNIQDLIFAVMQIVAVLGNLGAFLSLAFNQKSIKHLHGKLQQIVDGADATEYSEIYCNTERKCHDITKRLFIAAIVLSIAATILPPIIHAIYSMWNGNYDADTWIVLFRADVPFNVSGLSKWLTMLSLELYVVPGVHFVNTIVALYFFSLCLYINAYCEHLQMKFRLISKKIERFQSARQVNEGHGRKVNGYEILTGIKKELSEVVSFRCDLMAVFDLVAYVNSGAIFSKYFSIQLISVYVIYDIFANPTYTNSFLFMDVLVITLCVTITFGMCYLSDFIADKISSHGELSYDLNWYQLPAELRSYFLLIIVQAQVPIQFSGFEIIDMHLKTFTQYVKATYMYSLVLKDI